LTGWFSCGEGKMGNKEENFKRMQGTTNDEQSSNLRGGKPGVEQCKKTEGLLKSGVEGDCQENRALGDRASGSGRGGAGDLNPCRSNKQ